MGVPSLDELNRIGEPLLSANKSLNLGPFIIAMILDTLLCGVLLMQCGAYTTLGKKDRLYLKVGVAYVMLMNVAITVFTWAWIYDLFVYNFGSYGLFLSLRYIPQYYILDPMTVIVVQAFFARRAWRLAKRNYFVLVILGTLILTAFAGGIAIKITCNRLSSMLDGPDVQIPAYIWMFTTVAADVMITGIIIVCLLRNKTGSRETDALIGRLWRMTFESQLPPTLIAIGLAVSYSINNSSVVSVPFICVQAKFYGISLLHTLNARETLKAGGAMTTEEGDIEFTKRSNNTFWVNSRFTAGKPSRTNKGDTHRHTQFTIMPEPRTRRVKAESLDSMSFKGVDLGDDDEPTSQRGDNGIGKISEVDLGELGVDSSDGADETLRDDMPRRSKRGGEFKLASMGLGGISISSPDGDRGRSG